jgi:hypothetical protein
MARLPGLLTLKKDSLRESQTRCAAFQIRFVYDESTFKHNKGQLTCARSFANSTIKFASRCFAKFSTA